MKPDLTIEEKAKQIVNELTLDEKIALMAGDLPFWEGFQYMSLGGYNKRTWPAGVITEKGISGILFSDGPRGIVLKGATTFPVSMARGASWDVDLEKRIGEVIGKELRINEGTFFGGICINLPRHPAWGRAQETYGEDPVLLGKMGEALCAGVQRHAMACVKHFALNSMENGRFKVDVQISDRALHEIYLSHFKRVVDSGVACVMSAYNSVNGEWCGQNKTLLTEILKEKWGFDGFVITDFIFGMRDAKKAALAGQDVEMPFPNFFARYLKTLVENGEVPISRIDDAAHRIIRQQLKLLPPVDYGIELNGCREHRLLAKESAEKSMVLLKNENNILPIKNVETIAVIGRLAKLPVTGDDGSSNTQPAYVVTPLEGIFRRFGNSAEIIYNDARDLQQAVKVASGADIVVLVVGFTREDEGEFISPDMTRDFVKYFPDPVSPEEKDIYNKMFLSGKDEDVSAYALGGDRKNLGLRKEEIELINEIAKVNKNVVVSIVAGSTVMMEEWRNNVPAIIMQWYAGMEGGNALASILAGDVNPSGKLPFVIPEDEAHLPYFDPNAEKITYDLWHGYRKLDRDGNKAAFPFGFGLSYTAFALDELKLNQLSFKPADILKARLKVKNNGNMNGEEVIQLYISAIESKVPRAPKELKAFFKTMVNAGEVKEIIFEIPISEIAYYDENLKDFIVEPINYQIFIGTHEQDEKALITEFKVEL